MTNPIPRHVAWGAVVALLLIWNPLGSDAAVEWRTTARLAVRAGKPYRDSLARWEAREHAAVTRAGALLAQSRSLRDSVALLTAALPDSTDAAVRRVLLVGQLAMAACQAGADSLQAALDLCAQRAHLAIQRADTLERLLTAGIKMSECRVWFVKCPSRGLTFLVGASAGFLGGQLAR